MRVVRPILAIVVFAASIVAAHRLCWMRLQCELEKSMAKRQMDRMAEADSYTRAAAGRAVISRLSKCAAYDPSDYYARFLLARAAQDADRYELALATFQSALELNERPELYAYIGVVQLEMGRPREARANLSRAVLFNAALAVLVAEPLRGELKEEALTRQKRLTEKLERAKAR